MDICQYIRQEIEAGLRAGVATPVSRRQLEGAAFTLYHRDTPVGVIFYVANKGDEDGDPIVVLAIVFDATSWSYSAQRCDRLIKPDEVKQASFPIARPTYGIGKVVAAVREVARSVYVDRAWCRVR